LAALGDGFEQTRVNLRGAIGGFDYLEFKLPLAVAASWILLASIAVAAALWIGDRRERIVVAATAAGSLAGPTYLYATSISHTGFGLQGRTILPLLVIPVIVSGDVLRRRASGVQVHKLAIASAAVIGLTACLQVAAWSVNARRFAVGVDGPLTFFADPEWGPPLGWIPWLALTVCGALLMIAAAIRIALSSRPNSDLEPCGAGSTAGRLA
jgi:Predicted membrane protein (DUF2142)